MEFSARQIADFLDGTIEGNGAIKVNSFSKIEEGKPGSLTFLANPKYEHYIYGTKASIVLVNNDFKPSVPIEATLIRVPNAYAALATLMNVVEQADTKKKGVDSTAFIAASAKVGKDCYVGNFVYIGENTVIGEGCRIFPHAYIGNGQYRKIPQLGNVVLEDEVEVGANTTIDRAVMDSTIIRKGVKLDNLIQIAHNVQVGENTVMASQVGISGSTKVGKQCMIGGQVGLGGHIHIGDGTQIGAQSGIISNIDAHSRIMGSPAIPMKNFFRSGVIFRKLPEMYLEINRLRKELDELKKEKR